MLNLDNIKVDFLEVFTIVVCIVFFGILIYGRITNSV
jgi:hypothetical protein